MRIIDSLIPPMARRPATNDNGALRRFLFTDQPGQVFLTSRKLTGMGQFKLLGRGLFYSVTCQELHLAIIEKDGEKRLYAWEKKDEVLDLDRCNLKVSIAVKTVEDGLWQLRPAFQILSRARTDATRLRPEVVRMAATLDYADFCLKDAGQETFFVNWTVGLAKNAAGRRQAEKKIKGVRCQLEVPRRIETAELFSVTAEHGRFKAVSFWPARTAWEAGEAPLAKRFIAFKESNAGWQVFWKKLDNLSALKQLVEKGKSTLPDLESALQLAGQDHSGIFPARAEQFKADWLGWREAWQANIRERIAAVLTEAESVLRQHPELRDRTQGVPPSPLALVKELDRFNARAKEVFNKFKEPWPILALEDESVQYRRHYIALQAIVRRPFLSVRIPSWQDLQDGQRQKVKSA